MPGVVALSSRDPEAVLVGFAIVAIALVVIGVYALIKHLARALDALGTDQEG